MTNITGINAAALLTTDTVTTTQSNNLWIIVGLGALALIIYLKQEGGKRK